MCGGIEPGGTGYKRYYVAFFSTELDPDLMPSDNGQTTYCNGRTDDLDARDDYPKREPGEHAGDGYCSRPAGWGTDHAGEGRCKMHAGNAGRPPSHGLHSQLREDLRQYVERAADLDAPGDLRGELAVVRGLLYRRLSNSEGLDEDLIGDAHKLLAELRRYSDTLHKQMTRERLTKEEEQKLFTTCGQILRKYVPDSDLNDALDELDAARSSGSSHSLKRGGE